MIPSREIDDLARELRDTAKGDEAGRFMLFLGAQCANAAGVPDTVTVARQVKELYGKAPELASSFSDSPETDPERDKTEYFAFLSTLSSSQRFRMLQSFYANVPVPLFYQNLALLLRAGYFRRVMTTNVDTLLEQALAGAGLQRGRHYRVVNLGADGTDRATESQMDVPDDETLIIKLHGDLADQVVGLTPDEIESTLRTHRRYMRSELEDDLILVGYDGESPPVEEWLGRLSHRAELWVVNRDLPHFAAESNDWARVVRTITGESASPESFFGQLALRLVNMPLKARLNFAASVVSSDPLPVGYDAPAVIDSSVESASSELAMIDEVRSQLRLCESVLASLEQSSVPGARAPQLEAQIGYQKRLIATLGDRLRDFDSSRKRLEELLDAVADVLDKHRDAVGNETFEYLRHLVQTVRLEHGRDGRNQRIVGAAVGGVVLLADRLGAELGPEAFGRSLVRDLAAFTPGLVKRGIR